MLKFVTALIVLTIAVCLTFLSVRILRKEPEKQTAGLAEYFESVSNVRIKDLCTGEDGEIIYKRNTAKADICFTLKTGGTVQLENRFQESGRSVIRDPGTLPGLDGYRFSGQLHQEEVVGWYALFKTVNRPLEGNTSEETLIYITKGRDGAEHVYVFS